MIQILGLLVFYLIASLPGMTYVLDKIEASKSRVRFKHNEKVKVLQYTEFYQFWFIVFFEVLKLAALIFILMSANISWLFAFLVGIVFPYWMRLKPRVMGVFPIVFVLFANVWLGLFYIIMHGIVFLKIKPLRSYIDLMYCTVVLLLFWVLNFDIQFIYITIAFISFQLVYLLLTFNKRTSVKTL